MFSRIIGTAVAGALLTVAGAAGAATKQSTFDVTATVVKNCVISATNLDFGAFDGSVDVANTSTIDVRCTATTPYTVSLSTGGSNNYTARTMLNGTDALFYNLYVDGAYGSVWGDGATSSTSTNGGTGTGMANLNTQSLTVHGRLLASANTGAIPGNYSDTITATVSY